jgi:hypothetical protein
MLTLIKKCAIALALVLALPTAFFGSALVVGIYRGSQDLAAYDEQIDSFEAYTVRMFHCGEIENENDYNAEPICRERCGSFFECRNDYLIMEERIGNESVILHEDAYTEAEYEEFYGRLEFADSITNPGSPPRPIIE